MLLTLLPDLSVAPLKYAYVLRDHGGPIASISFREREIEGEKFFEAFAHLDETTTGFRSENGMLYGDAHGMGTARTKAEAIFKAISEALERWAWFSATRDPKLHSDLRLDLDSSTTGFAAFPGLGVQGARKRAHFEASERWALSAWWEGKTTHKGITVLDQEGIELKTGIPGTAVVILWKNFSNLRAYGFAASFSARAAAEKAVVELRRNIEALKHFQDNAEAINTEELSLTEKRLRFFAETKGRELFNQRLAHQGNSCAAPKLIVDMGVVGPWTQYAHVWRCLFEGGEIREKEKESYFLF